MGSRLQSLSNLSEQEIEKVKDLLESNGFIKDKDISLEDLDKALVHLLDGGEMLPDREILEVLHADISKSEEEKYQEITHREHGYMADGQRQEVTSEKAGKPQISGVESLLPKNADQNMLISIQADSGVVSASNLADRQTMQVGLNSAVRGNTRFLVVGQPQATTGVVARNMLLMRCRMGSLFRSGGASIELTLEGIEKMDPEELAEVTVNMLKHYVKDAPNTKLVVSGNVPHHVLEAIKAQTKKHGFHVSQLPHALPHAEEAPSEKTTSTRGLSSPWALPKLRIGD